MSAEVDRVRHVIIGIGVDVNQDGGGISAGAAKDRHVAEDRGGRGNLPRGTGDGNFARAGCGLRADLRRKISEVADEWEAGCATIGKNVTRCRWATRKFAAARESLDDDGALLVRTEHGHLERVIGGDVTLEK
jgi:biotin-(acetyl-CoA carboxylase) ligase